MLNIARTKPGRNIVARAIHRPTPWRHGSPRACPSAKALPVKVKHMLKNRRINLDVKSPLSARILQGPTLRHLAAMLSGRYGLEFASTYQNGLVKGCSPSMTD